MHSIGKWINQKPGATAGSQFDAHTEVSADAKAIMQRLTLLLFWMPLLFGVIGIGLYLFH